MNRLLSIKSRHFLSVTVKKYSTNCIYSEEFSVNPFCNLFVACPFNVKIRPLDVHNYPHCDKLIIKLYSNLPQTKSKVTCIQDKIKFNIFGESSENEIVDCFIETPVKSDLNVIINKNGGIDVKKINGEKIILHTESGNIFSESCQNSKINFSSINGNITTLGTLHAAEIELKTMHSANIQINHLQALKANIATENGDIKIKSSYCDETIIETKRGKLYLDNIHKKCSITILENGLLQMTGFDGTLTANIGEADMDIQVSKLYDVSKIEAKEKSSILLRISDWIQENTLIKTTCQQLKVSDEVKLTMQNKETCAVLMPKNSKHVSELEIKTNLSNVIIEGASWSDMLKLKGIKFID